MPELTIDNIIAKVDELVTPANVDDARIDPAAQGSVLRQSQAGDAEKVSALALLAGVKSEIGGLNGIVGDDSAEAAELASELQIEVSELLPDGEAAVVTPPDAAPTVVFRAALREDPLSLDRSLAATIGASREMLASTAQLGEVGDPTRPWLCTWICGLCALALLDGVPFDEIPVCAACLTCIAGNG